MIGGYHCVVDLNVFVSFKSQGTTMSCPISSDSTSGGAPSTCRAESIHPGYRIEFVATDEFMQLAGADVDVALVGELTSRVPEPRISGSPDSHAGHLVARNLPLLSAEEERVLFRRMNYVKFQAEAIRSSMSPQCAARKRIRVAEMLTEAGHIRRTLAESNLRLVVSLARKYSPTPQEFDEYVSDGLLILLGAIDKFDYSRGFRFSTYATHAIRRHFFRLCRRGQKQAERFRPTAGEAMAELAAADERQETAGDPAALYRRLMESAGDRLTEREETVLHRRFGTDGRRMTQTLREVAMDLGISKERVRQIQIAALDKLRSAARELKLQPAAG